MKLLTYNLGDEMRFASVLEKFSEYCNPRKNITILLTGFLHIDNRKGKTSMILSRH